MKQKLLKKFSKSCQNKATLLNLGILILAIKLHSVGKVSTTNTVIIAILIPLAPIYYLASLRKPLKEYENRPLQKQGEIP